MENSTIVNSLGLAIDIVGAGLVFFNSPEKTHITYAYQHSELEALKIKTKRIRMFAQSGFALLAIGFLLQLTSNFFK